MSDKNRFILAGFSRNPGDDSFARVLEKQGMLDLYALGTRRGTKTVPLERTRLKPIFGLLNYVAANSLPVYQAESFRFRLFGWFDRWVQTLIRPGQNILVATAFAPGAMYKAKLEGGLSFLQSWTTHPKALWDLVQLEHEKWEAPHLPVSKYYQERALESVEAADYACAPSTFAIKTFLDNGFRPDRLLFCPLWLDLAAFVPAIEPRPADRPFTILHTGGLSLRKGAPYLLEAFRLIKKEIPNAVFKVRHHLRNDIHHILRQYKDVPIEWADHLSFSEHVRRYQTSDLLLFPSIEDGFAYVVAEALACGLPVVTTTNTGASDLIQPGVNGEVVPICDARALADAALNWWERIRTGEKIGGRSDLVEKLSFQTFEQNFLGHLSRLGMISSSQ